MLAIMVENVGAEMGCLILQWEGEWRIAACRNGAETTIYLNQPIPLESVDSRDVNLHLSQEIVNTVIRTRVPIVLNHAAHTGAFSHTRYIRQQQTKSVLCFPLIHQGQLIGILYLENNLTTDAFTTERLEVLNLLAGQAAVALDNARLYANLENQVAERTQALSQALEDLKTTQDELIQSEKMATLGQLIAGIAHELNTPLAAIRSSAGSLNHGLTTQLKQLPAFIQTLPLARQTDFITLLERSNHQGALLSTRGATSA